VAVYRCEVKRVSRSDGRSAVAAAAYRSASRGTNDRDGVTHDYRRRAKGVVHSELLAPANAPDWAQQRDRLWNEAEAAENRRNSVTAREVIVSLPHELDDRQRADLVRGFAAGLVERYGVAVDMSIHRPDPKGDNRNHHAHLMMTSRRMTAEGLAAKTRELDDRKTGPLEIEAIRALWEREQNNALSKADVPERVTRKSLAEQGIDREPQPKIGEAANALMRRGEPSRRGELHKEVADRNAMKENTARVMAMREQEEEQRRVTMREHMARQRSERLEAEKREAVTRALDAAAQQAARDQAEKKERAEKNGQRRNGKTGSAPTASAPHAQRHPLRRKSQNPPASNRPRTGSQKPGHPKPRPTLLLPANGSASGRKNTAASARPNAKPTATPKTWAAPASATRSRARRLSARWPVGPAALPAAQRKAGSLRPAGSASRTRACAAPPLVSTGRRRTCWRTRRIRGLRA
jgi:hypothetical protein